MKVYNLEQWELWRPTTPYVFIVLVRLFKCLNLLEELLLATWSVARV